MLLPTNYDSPKHLRTLILFLIHIYQCLCLCSISEVLMEIWDLLKRGGSDIREGRKKPTELNEVPMLLCWPRWAGAAIGQPAVLWRHDVEAE